MITSHRERLSRKSHVSAPLVLEKETSKLDELTCEESSVILNSDTDHIIGENSIENGCKENLTDSTVLLKRPNTEELSDSHPKKLNVEQKYYIDVFNKTPKDLVSEKLILQDKIAKKEEIIRKLSMVKMYRSKNNLSHLQQLIDKWLSVCQEGLLELWNRVPEPRPTLIELIDHLQIDPKMICYNQENDHFETPS